MSDCVQPSSTRWQLWYEPHLRAYAARLLERTESDCREPRGERGWPALEKGRHVSRSLGRCEVRRRRTLTGTSTRGMRGSRPPAGTDRHTACPLTDRPRGRWGAAFRAPAEAAREHRRVSKAPNTCARSSGAAGRR
jgi:hypothetical protein